MTLTRSIGSPGLAIVLVAFAAMASPPYAHATPERWKAQEWGKTDFSKTKVKWSEILSGGPPKDGIPSIDKPKFKPAADIKDMPGREPVIGLELNGDARAYPLRVLTWHEIVNDIVGGVPVAITYCPLCNSAIVFRRKVAGKVLDFGTTGKLRNSDLVMYDRQTESWWQQFTGEAIVGTMLGTTLDTVPARLESFERFVKRYPKGKVLVPNNPTGRSYGRNPYAGYDTARQPFLYRGEMPEGIEPMARVVVIEVKAKRVAVSLALLRKKGQMTVGDTRLEWIEGQASALDDSEIAKGREVGNVVATRISGPDAGKDVRYDVTFAFVFHAFHPKNEMIKG